MIRVGEKYISGLFNAPEDCCTVSLSDSIRRQETSPLRVFALDCSSRLLEPVHYEVCGSWNPTIVHLPQCGLVGFPQLALHPLPAQERRIAHNHIHFRPFRFHRISVEVNGKYRIAALDVVKVLQDWLLYIEKAVRALPLEVAN